MAQPAVTAEDGGQRYVCGGWAAAATAEALVLDGEGSGADGLRALCAAAWAAAGGGAGALDAAKALARLDL